MTCETCGGTGCVLPMTATHLILSYYPCPDCGGCGITHCCEGDQAPPSVEPAAQLPQSATEDPPTDHRAPTS